MDEEVGVVPADVLTQVVLETADRTVPVVPMFSGERRDCLGVAVKPFRHGREGLGDDVVLRVALAIPGDFTRRQGPVLEGDRDRADGGVPLPFLATRGIKNLRVALDVVLLHIGVGEPEVRPKLRLGAFQS